MRKHRSNKGMSLLELLITVFLLSVGILSSLMFFIAAIESTDLARDMTTATTHAEYVLEEMKSRTSLANITATDWKAWSNGSGLNTLPSEVINVSYTDSLADPLEIFVTVNWTKKNRTNNISVTTKMTK